MGRNRTEEELKEKLDIVFRIATEMLKRYIKETKEKKKEKPEKE